MTFGDTLFCVVDNPRRFIAVEIEGITRFLTSLSLSLLEKSHFQIDRKGRNYEDVRRILRYFMQSDNGFPSPPCLLNSLHIENGFSNSWSHAANLVISQYLDNPIIYLRTLISIELSRSHCIDTVRFTIRPVNLFSWDFCHKCNMAEIKDNKGTRVTTYNLFRFKCVRVCVCLPDACAWDSCFPILFLSLSLSLWTFATLHFPAHRDQIFHIPAFPHLYRWSLYGYTSNFNVLFPQSICKNKWILCIYRTIINIDGSVAILSHLLFNVNSWLLLVRD